MTLLKLSSKSGAQLEFLCAAGQKLSQAIWLSGMLESPPLCCGLGLCGRCRVRFLGAPPEPVPEDVTVLSNQELTAGWRLACHHIVPTITELALEIPEIKTLPQVEETASAAGHDCALGIDLGTTSVQWRAVNPGAPNVALDSGSFANPQAGAGADVISRLAYALTPGGLSRLSWLARKAIGGIVIDLEKKGLLATRACIAANTIMTGILLEKDISSLAASPYSLLFHGNEITQLALPGLNRRLPTLIPPLPAPFAGSDLSSGLLALLQEGAPRPFVLADLGTNAELALMDSAGKLFIASAPLGPALEGIGPANGQTAGPGVITGFALNASGLEPQFFGDKPAARIAGISATGYISLLAILLKIGLMQSSGLFNVKPQTLLASRIASEITSNRLTFADSLFITTHDVEMLLKVKAALAVAFRRIFQAANIAPAQISALWLAGALGTYSRPDDLAVLGMIPANLAAKTHACGNTALQGACILACQPEESATLATLCASAKIVQLAEDPDFPHDFLSLMRWGDNAA